MSAHAILIVNTPLIPNCGQNSFALNTSLAMKEGVDLILGPFSPPEKLKEKVGSIKTKFVFRNARHKKIKIVIFQIYLIFFLLSNRRAHYFFSLKPYMFGFSMVDRIFKLNYSLMVEGYIPGTVDRLWPRPFNYFGKKLSSRLVWRARKVAACYLEALDWVESIRGKERDQRLIYCGVLADNSKAKGQRPVRQQFDICYVGSFRRVHLLDCLVDLAVHANLSVVFVGDGPLLKELKARCESESNGRFLFVGFQPQDVAMSYMRASHVGWGMCDPRHPGVPMKVFEYAANGLPSMTMADKNFNTLLDCGAVVVAKDVFVESLFEAFESAKVLRGGGFAQEVRYKYSWSKFSNYLL